MMHGTRAHSSLNRISAHSKPQMQSSSRKKMLKISEEHVRQSASLGTFVDKWSQIIDDPAIQRDRGLYLRDGAQVPPLTSPIKNSVMESRSDAKIQNGRILYDIPCKVCRDHSSGKHYGIFACDGCAGFFKRSIRRNRQYVCKAKSEGGCTVDKTHRNQCRACRLAKCMNAGMNKDAVQHERGPRNSTLRRQMALYFKEPEIITTMVQPPAAALDLALPKPPSQPRVTVAPPPPPSHPPISHPIYCNSIPMDKLPLNIGLIPSIPILPLMTPESICEQAARVLFLNVRWARELAADSGLTMDDQLTLLEASWRELFLLAAAQMLPNLDPSFLLPGTPAGFSLAIEVTRFRETLAGFHSMGLDAQEYACLRAIVLFKAGLDCELVPSSRSSNGSVSPTSERRLRDPITVARLRDGAQFALGEKLSVSFNSGPSLGALRFGKLLLLLPTLRSVSAHAIEELFFRRTIGIIPIERIICDMYKTPEKI